jgi:uncharacterized protein (TIGR01619 family)
MKTLLCLFLLLTVSQKLFAQNEIWDNYMASYENKPGSVVVRMDLVSSAPLKEYKYVLVTGTTYESKDSEGLPDNITLLFVQKIGNELQQILMNKYENIYVGSLTYNFERLEYFYVKDTIGLRQTLNKFYESKYLKIKKYVNLKIDSDWKYYKEFLYPNENILNYMADNKVVMSLVENGDKLNKSRKVDHFSYFKSQREAQEFRIEIEKEGYNIEIVGKNDIGDYPYKVLFWKNQFVDLEHINQVTTNLKEIAKKYNGEYDGWETVVVKE